MIPQEKIIHYMEALHKELPSLSLKYEYRKYLDLHIIEVLPLSDYKTNDEYINSEIEFEKEFLGLFPTHDILFVSEDSLTQISNITFKIDSND